MTSPPTRVFAAQNQNKKLERVSKWGAAIVLTSPQARTARFVFRRVFSTFRTDRKKRSGDKFTPQVESCCGASWMNVLAAASSGA
jgi:hypothetical protein